PVIRTKAPNGRDLTPYSVSPRLVDHRVFPKPTKNWVTFMPNFLAVRKCPSSCRTTEMSTATTKMTTPSRKPMLPPLSVPSRPAQPSPASSRQLTGPVPGPAVGGKNVVQRHLGPTGPVMLRDYPGHGIDDSRKPEPARQERLDADLVGGVIDGRGR